MEFLQRLFLGIGLMTLVFLSCIFFDIAYNDFQHKYVEYHSTNFCKDSPTYRSGGGIARHIK